MICIAGFLSIKVTSPVTHMVSSAARGVVQTLLSVWFFGDIITGSVVSCSQLLRADEIAQEQLPSPSSLSLLCHTSGSNIRRIIRNSLLVNLELCSIKMRKTRYHSLVDERRRYKWSCICGFTCLGARLLAGRKIDAGFISVTSIFHFGPPIQ